ncbi:MAG: amino acid ABC transporter substrate-binding protein [Anaerolineaceae bacterium]|nr:amino acid ABC transporter substrate-binding protein [Anaerolineaceae bacterium]
MIIKLLRLQNHKNLHLHRDENHILFRCLFLVIPVFLVFCSACAGSGTPPSPANSTNAHNPPPPNPDNLSNPPSSLAGIQEKGVIVIGTALTQPFEYRDPETGHLIGMDVDIAESIAQELGVKPQWVEMPFANLLPALEEQKIDITIAGMYITQERESIVDFSQPYLMTGLVMATHPDLSSQIHSTNDLAGLNVGVKIGATGESFAQDLIQHGISINIIQYKNTLDSLLDLEVGRVDIVFNDYLNTLYYIKDNQSNISIVKDINQEVVFLSHASLGIAVNKQNQALLNEINRLLTEMEADGSTQAYYTKWLLPANQEN